MPGKYTVQGDKPDGSGHVGFGYGTLAEAKQQEADMIADGYKNVRIVESKLPNA